MARPHAEGPAEFVTLPQAGRAKAWHLTAQGAAAAATFPDARRPGAGRGRSGHGLSASGGVLGAANRWRAGSTREISVR